MINKFWNIYLCKKKVDTILLKGWKEKTIQMQN